jgi:hypothetical protein
MANEQNGLLFNVLDCQAQTVSVHRPQTNDQRLQDYSKICPMLIRPGAGLRWLRIKSPRCGN